MAFALEVNPEGIATLTFDLKDEKVNKFSLPVLSELEKVLDQAASNPKIKVLILKSGKKDHFIAGADLHAFKDAEHNPDLIVELIQTGHRVFNKLAKLPFPTIALIHGVCLGGGLECALACTYRIATDHPKTQIGLPEVTLGIIPGWGGTQRLPRLIGLQQALTMILAGSSIDGAKAAKLGVVDLLAPSNFREERALALAQQVIDKPLKRPKRGSWLLERNPLGRAVLFHQAKKNVLERTKGHYPAPLVALDVIKKSRSLPLAKGLLYEQEQFVTAIGKEFAIAANLVNLFFINESLKKQPAAEKGAAKPVSIAGVIGAGTMGGGIAWLFSYRDFDIRMKDINWEAVGQGYAAARTIYNQLVKKKKLRPYEADIKFHKIGGTVSYSSFRGCDVVVEAAVENLDIKRKIFKELEEVISPTALIGSNTSSLTIADMSREMKHPERFVGLHFFNPVNRMPLVEVVKGPKSSDDAIATAVALCQQLKKTPIVVGDCPGFLVNRVFMAGANEIFRMLEEGVPMKKIEKALEDFGMPMSPFLLVDEIGGDVTYKVAKTLESAYGPRMKTPSIFEKMYHAKLFGKKTGKGIYIYEGKNTTLNPVVREWVGDKHLNLSEEQIVLRTMLMMVNEASRCLDEKIVDNAGYLDMALIMGTGFPAFRGGLLRWADEKGVSWIKSRMDQFSQVYGPRFTPSDYLTKLDYEGRFFY